MTPCDENDMTLCDKIYWIAELEADMMSNALSKWGSNNEKSYGRWVESDLEKIKEDISKYNPSAIFCRDPCQDIQEFIISMQSAIAHFNRYIAEIAGVCLNEFSPPKSVEPKDVLDDSRAIWSVHNSLIPYVNALDPKINTPRYNLGSDEVEIALLRDIHQRNRAKSKPPYSNTD